MADNRTSGNLCRWVSNSDVDLLPAEADALDALLTVARDCGAAIATTCGYDDPGHPLGSVTVALVAGLVLGIAVRNDANEHAVIVTTLADEEPAYDCGDDVCGGRCQ